MLLQLGGIYGPLGWIDLYLLPVKQLFQRLYGADLGPSENRIRREWSEAWGELEEIAIYRVPRWYLQTFGNREVTTGPHVFSDVSKVVLCCIALHLTFAQIGVRISVQMVSFTTSSGHKFGEKRGEE